MTLLLDCAWTSFFSNYCGTFLADDECNHGLMACSERLVVSEFIPLERTCFSCVEFGSSLICLGVFMQRKTTTMTTKPKTKQYKEQTNRKSHKTKPNQNTTSTVSNTDNVLYREQIHLQKRNDQASQK